MKLLPLRQVLVINCRGVSGKIQVPAVVDCQWLNENKDKVKILDASYTLTRKANHDTFMVRDYGDFEKLMEKKVNEEYAHSHIPGAVHFNLDVANYPGRYAHFGMYPPRIFEKYMQLLGLNNYDKIIVYGRGRAAGMLFASRVWWTLKLYGHEAVGVLDGGFGAWQEAVLPVSSGVVTPKKGSWKANEVKTNRLVELEELISLENGMCLLDNLHNVNFLDTRIKDQFDGKEQHDFPIKILDSIGFDKKKPTYLMCIKAIQASLVNLALERNGLEGKLYNGSMVELAARASHFVKGK